MDKESHCLFVTGSLPLQGRLLKISVLQAVKTFRKKGLALLLLCVSLCWIIAGCTRDKLSDEAAEDHPHIRIETYRALIQACKKHAALEESKPSFDVENITYKGISDKYEEFHEAENSEDDQISKKFEVGKKAWNDLKNKLKSDNYVLEDLEKVEQGLLEYLRTTFST
jgi:hypothetical protein